MSAASTASAAAAAAMKRPGTLRPDQTGPLGTTTVPLSPGWPPSAEAGPPQPSNHAFDVRGIILPVNIGAIMAAHAAGIHPANSRQCPR
jgi:hypothetical protein